MDQKLRELATYMSVHGERDDALFWIDIYACQCLNRLDKTEQWLFGSVDGTAPEELLSAFMRPGTDSSRGIVHRMYSLLRRVSLEQTERGPVFFYALEHMTAFFEELKRVFGWIKIADAQLDFFELMDYLTAAKEKHHSPERYRATMESKVEAFLAAWTVLYELCQTEESARRAIPAENAYDRCVQNTVAELREEVASKKGRGRPLAVVLPTKCWLVRSWFYLVDHPSFCRADVKGKRVLRQDFWARYEKELKTRGLNTEESAIRALRTALANARDGLLGEECRQLILTHSTRVE